MTRQTVLSDTSAMAQNAGTTEPPKHPWTDAPADQPLADFHTTCPLCGFEHSFMYGASDPRDPDPDWHYCWRCKEHNWRGMTAAEYVRMRYWSDHPRRYMPDPRNDALSMGISLQAAQDRRAWLDGIHENRIHVRTMTAMGMWF